MAAASFVLTSTSPTCPARYRAFRSSTSPRFGIERVVVDEDRVALDRAGNVGADPLRIGVHLPDLLDDRLGASSDEIDRVAVALAHLPVVEARQPRRRREQRLRLDEHLAVEVVEPPDDLARELEVRHLILADRHEVRVVDDDVGGLQQRIAEEAEVRQILVGELLDLLLVGRHALEPRDRRDHLQQQVQLGVLGHERLDEERALLRIDAGARSSRRRCRARWRRSARCSA